MIISNWHLKVKQLGRHLTLGQIRQDVYHVNKGSSVIKRYINECVTCRKNRGAFQQQIMAPLPADRLEEVPPFTNVGVDLFGPYLVHDGQSTRRTKCTKKVWGLLITCLVSRAAQSRDTQRPN